MIDSMVQIDRLVAAMSTAEDPVAEIEAAYQQALEALVREVAAFDPLRLMEVARIAWLPWSIAGLPGQPDAGAGPARVELLAAIALSVPRNDESTEGPIDKPQAMSRFVSESSDRLDNLVRLAQLRDIASVDPADRMRLIALIVRGSQVWIRNSSYAEAVQGTVKQVLDENSIVRDELVAGLGFTASDALAVLDAVHDAQTRAMNQRFERMADSLHAAMDSVVDGGLDPAVRNATRTELLSAWEPDEDECTVSVAEVAAATGLALATVGAVIDRFRVDVVTGDAGSVVSSFVAGDNPWRTRPLAVTSTGRVMMPHNALNVDAVRWNLEEFLKGTASWDVYAKHRGEVLESRVADALNQVVPGATVRNGFQYYVPATAAELELGDPSRYTKRVEADHLLVLDDLALVAEDKAGSFSLLARSGKASRIRADLTRIVTEAADQGGRLRDAILRDGGLRIEGEGWVDLSEVREVHTIAVSMDDLSNVSTATAELVRAALLSGDNIPWTVSLHDLELIVELIARPAEFLLYLRRRRNPGVTDMFTAADELDLFLYFYEEGLWVEPDPEALRAAFPWMPSPTTAERRRFRTQGPAVLTSRTDALDRWFYAQQGRLEAVSTGGPEVEKPQMVASPLSFLLDWLQTNMPRGWLSMSATLMGMATGAQHEAVADVRRMLANPTGTTAGRSLTVPLVASAKPNEAWLLVWATLPPGVDRESEKVRLGEYLRAKKHQLGIERAMLFLFDESSGEVIEALFASDVGPLPKELEERLPLLRDAGSMTSRQHPNAWKARKRRR